MNKLKNIFLLLLLGVVVIFSCSDDTNSIVNPFANINYEELAISDNDSIVKFLTTHYYNSTVDSIKLIESADLVSILKDKDLIITEITKNEIDYKLYTYIVNKGIPNPNKGYPSVIDSVFINYSEIILANNNLDRNPFNSGENIWLSNVITGWAKGLTYFKSGENITNNGPITFQNPGEGYVFIPSGLAFPSINYIIGQDNGRTSPPPYDLILVFKTELLDLIENTDHDNDGIPSIKEDANEDGDPTNDFSDNSNPNVPDYLNPNIKKNILHPE